MNTCEDTRPTDPDPFTIVALILSALGTAGTIAQVFLQRAEQSREELLREEELRDVVINRMRRFLDRLTRLRHMVEEARDFIVSYSPRVDIRSQAFTLSPVVLNLEPTLVQRYHRLKVDLLSSSRELVDLELEIALGLAKLRVILTEEAIAATERFRALLREMTSPRRSFEEGLYLLARATEEGLKLMRLLEQELSEPLENRAFT